MAIDPFEFPAKFVTRLEAMTRDSAASYIERARGFLSKSTGDVRPKGVPSRPVRILSVDSPNHPSAYVRSPIRNRRVRWTPQMADETFISEAIVPDAATFDAAAMASGQPGLPTGFTWRDRHYVIAETITQWKASEREFHRKGEAYYRKHFWKVRVDSGEVMTLYAVRHVKRGESAKGRWWLYSIENALP